MDPIGLKLVLEFETGMTESGDAILSKATLSNLRITLTAEELRQIALVFASLIKHPLIDACAVYTNRIRAENI